MKLNKPQYTNKFVMDVIPIVLDSGETIIPYSIGNLTENEKDEWAKHILAHYTSKDNIIQGAKLEHCTEEEYIRNRVLPSVTTQAKDVSGNFGEIVFCDFIEYVLGYNVPRYKLYENMPGNPTQGIDIVAYKKDISKSENDIVIFSEIKSRLSCKNCKILQEAINDIAKRKEQDFALALDMARRKLRDMKNDAEMEDIMRFQDSEKPCKRLKYAGIITSADYCTATDFIGVRIESGYKIEAHVLYAKELWLLVKDLWERACK